MYYIFSSSNGWDGAWDSVQGDTIQAASKALHEARIAAPEHKYEIRDHHGDVIDVPDYVPDTPHWEIEVIERSNKSVVRRGHYEGNDITDHVRAKYRTPRPNATSGAQLYYATSHYDIRVFTDL